MRIVFVFRSDWIIRFVQNIEKSPKTQLNPMLNLRKLSYFSNSNRTEGQQFSHTRNIRTIHWRRRRRRSWWELKKRQTLMGRKFQITFCAETSTKKGNRWLQFKQGENIFANFIKKDFFCIKIAFIFMHLSLSIYIFYTGIDFFNIQSNSVITNSSG